MQIQEKRKLLATTENHYSFVFDMSKDLELQSVEDLKVDDKILEKLTKVSIKKQVNMPITLSEFKLQLEKIIFRKINHNEFLDYMESKGFFLIDNDSSTAIIDKILATYKKACQGYKLNKVLRELLNDNFVSDGDGESFV